MSRRINEWPEWPNARDWVGLGTFGLTIMLLWMMKGDPQLMRDDFFKTLSTLIIGTGFINGVVSWAYSSTKTGGELAEKNAEIIKQRAATDAAEPTGTETHPTKVEVTNTATNAVPTTPGKKGGK